MKKLLLCLAVAVGGLTLFASTNTAQAHGGYRFGGGGGVGYRSGWNGYGGGNWNTGYRTNVYRGGYCGPYGCYNNWNSGWYGNSCYGSGLYLNTPGFGFSTYGW